ncbi:MAG: hypothetical protein ACR2JU_01805 [Nocardioidaceae bacterium]
MISKLSVDDDVWAAFRVLAGLAYDATGLRSADEWDRVGGAVDLIAGILRWLDGVVDPQRAHLRKRKADQTEERTTGAWIRIVASGLSESRDFSQCLSMATFRYVGVP